MNQNSSSDSSVSSSSGATDPVSRRAYELWEKDGRPEGCDLKHWLQAEQELGSSRSDSGQPGNSDAGLNSARQTGADTRPLAGTRGSSTASRETKRPPATSPYNNDRTGAGNGQNAGKRKPSSAPVL